VYGTLHILCFLPIYPHFLCKRHHSKYRCAKTTEKRMGSSRCRAAAVWPARYGDEQGTVRHYLSTSGFTKTAAQRTREHWSIYDPPRMPKTETLPIVKLLHQCLPSKTLTSLSKHFLEQLRQRLWLRGPQQKSLLLV